jgi:hypothetical protein
MCNDHVFHSVLPETEVGELAENLGAVRSFHGIVVVVFLSPLSRSHLSICHYRGLAFSCS